jgi:uncharacterized protein (TIRG00374 family)
MAAPLPLKLLRRGLEVFAIISVIVFAAVLFYGNNLELFLDAMLTLRWEWLLLGLGLATMDWIGGGLRLYVLGKHVYPETSLKGSILSAGLNYWATLLTPSQAGGGPVGIWVLKHYGTPLPVAMVVTFMSFVATILFFAVAGPLTIVFGAGESLERHGVLGVVSLRELYLLSLSGFITVGAIMLFLIIFPGVARRLARRVVRWLERRGSAKLAGRVETLNAGIDRAHESMVAFFKGRGWLSLLGAVVLTGVAMANKLVSGYVVLRALGIQAQFVDVVLLQTLIVFLLYFAPTPGGSGLAEVLSAAVMSIYVPRELTPSYILLWRLIVSYLSLLVGSVVFWRVLKEVERGTGKEPEVESLPELDRVARPDVGN